MKNKRIIIGFMIALLFVLVGGSVSIALVGGYVNNQAAAQNGLTRPSSSKSSSSSRASSSRSSSRKSSSSRSNTPSQPSYSTSYSSYTEDSTDVINEFIPILSPEKNFYKLGDELLLNGERKVEEITTEYYETTTTYKDGVSQGTSTPILTKTEERTEYYFVDITFEGFRVAKGEVNLPKKIEEKDDIYNVFLDECLNTDDWKMELLKIVELVPTEFLNYDSERGVVTGKITAHSACGASKEFIIPFQFAPEGYTVDVYSDNPYLGTVSDSLSGKFEGQSVTVSATEKVEGAFQHWYKKNADGSIEIVSTDKNYTFIMPACNLVLVASFKYDVTTYKLWVTSNNTEWGETWTYDNDNAKTTYVEKAVPSKEYDLKYDPAPGYKFVRWEYRPYFDNDFEKNGKIKMPDHDITVTAIFEKEDKDLEELGDKNLIITVNNPEWGTAGDSVPNVIPGEKYQIWQEAKPGYYFTGWIYSPTYLDNPLTLEPSVIMPEETVTVTAFFSPKTELYSVKTSVEPEENVGKIVGNPSEAAPGEKFEVTANATNNEYEFDYWYYLAPNPESDTDSNPDKVKLIVSRESTATITMPAHDLDLVAVFKKVGKYNLYVTSNNPEWGEAWTTPDDSDEHVWNRTAEEGKEYSINALENTGYEFVEFVYKPEMENPLESEGKIKMPPHDITVTAIFKKSETETKDNPTLYISVNNPKWGKAYIVDKNGGKYYASEEPMGEPNRFIAEAGETYDIFYEANEAEGYKFVGWYTSPDIGLGNFAEDITMPIYDLTLTAFFAPVIDSHSLTVKSDPPEAGNAWCQEEETYYFGEEYEVGVIPNEGYEFEYWYYVHENEDGEKIKIIESRKEEFDFEMPNYDVELFAKFEKKRGGSSSDSDPDPEPEPIEPSDPIPPEDIPTPPDSLDDATSLNVSSVRDLRWKDHFVDKYGNYIDANALRIPIGENAGEKLIVEHSGYPTELKMGYAVEFEMKTIMVPKADAKLVIKPELYLGSSKIEWNKVTDELTGKALSEPEYEKYRQITIDSKGNTTDGFQAESTATDPRPMNNNVEYDEVTWNWVYYLPAKLLYKPINQDLTVKFNIELYDYRYRDGKEKVLDYIESLDGISKWQGKVFKYSWKDSLLDDIYDNATN